MKRALFVCILLVSGLAHADKKATPKSTKADTTIKVPAVKVPAVKVPAIKLAFQLEVAGEVLGRPSIITTIGKDAMLTTKGPEWSYALSVVATRTDAKLVHFDLEVTLKNKGPSKIEKASIDAAWNETAQMSFQIDGQLVILSITPSQTWAK